MNPDTSLLVTKNDQILASEQDDLAFIENIEVELLTEAILIRHHYESDRTVTRKAIDEVLGNHGGETDGTMRDLLPRLDR